MVCLFIFSKNQLLALLTLAMVSFVSFAFISALRFMISFLLLTLEFFIYSFSSCFRCKVWLFIWFFSCFWGKLVLLWTFPLPRVFLNPIGVVLSCFHFHLFLCIFWFLKVSSVICWLFRRVLFTLHMFVFLIVFSPCSWQLILLHCDQKRCLKWFNFFFKFTKVDLCPRIWSILENVLCALEKKVKFIVLGWNVL